MAALTQRRQGLETGDRQQPGRNLRTALELLGGAPEPARFIVIDNPERDQVSSELLTEGPTADGRAKVLARHGLWYDSIEAYTALINSHASAAEFYEKRAEIYEQIPATQELARIDREKAENLERQPQ